MQLSATSSWGTTYLRVCVPALLNLYSTCDKQSSLAPVTAQARGTFQQVADFVSRQPDLQIPISRDAAQTWLLNTYLDEVKTDVLHHAPLSDVGNSGIRTPDVTGFSS